MKMTNANIPTLQILAKRLCILLLTAICAVAVPAASQEMEASYLSEQAYDSYQKQYQKKYRKKAKPARKTKVKPKAKGRVKAKSKSKTTAKVKSKSNSKFAYRKKTRRPVNLFKPEMVLVEGGSFIMGCMHGNCGRDESPWHPVVMGNFYIGKYEVTQQEWDAVMGKGNNPSMFKGKKRPMENITWDEVQTFIERLNKRTGKCYRLPTEAEWEYAAHGGIKSKGYTYSGSEILYDVAWYARNRTYPVGRKRPNELGLYDMSGNVWEWCADRYAPYNSSVQYSPVGVADSADRVLRGGGWTDDSKNCRITNRLHTAPNNAHTNLGFRLAHPYR
jgi:formylglycine-generating enzyme required for sulfatase activity